MLAILSPAKKLDLTRPLGALPATTPSLMADAQRMMSLSKKLSRTKMRQLMGISEKLAELNWQRHHQFETPFTPENAYRAALCFAGDVYFGLDAKTLSEADFAWSQDRLAILSGMFGLLPWG